MSTSLKIQAAGVNTFLDMVYGPGARPSALLEALGCTPEQVAALRSRCLEAFVDAFVRCIADRLARYDDGERKYWVLARRLGLDGERPATLAALGAELGVSRERIRQIEGATLRRCRFLKQRHFWLEALYTCAADLLVGEGIALQPFDPYRAARVIARLAPLADAPVSDAPAEQEALHTLAWQESPPPDTPSEISDVPPSPVVSYSMPWSINAAVRDSRLVTRSCWRSWSTAMIG
jgi:hypothetical protein